jgi:hypothetical protein
MSEQDVDDWKGRAKPGMPLFPGPPDVREAFILSKGIDWTASYIDPALWLSASRMIVARTNIAYERIRDQGSFVCEKLKVSVRRPMPGQRAAA